MKDLITLTDIKSLEQRYPFSELEMEILVRCYENLALDETATATIMTGPASTGAGDDSPSFLMSLALASPYSHYFLPEDECGQSRLAFLENNVLPAGFSNRLRDAISSGDAFVEVANQHQDEGLERFLEGVADTGRRGSKQALAVLYQLVGGGDASASKAFDIMDVCYRVALAAEVLEAPSFDKNACLAKVKQLGPVVQDVSEMLERHCEQDFTLNAFVDWAESRFPMLSAPLSTFVHHLLFHEHPYPEGRIPYQLPVMDQKSDVFTEESSPMLTTMCLTSAPCNNKWHRLYSYQQDGANFESLSYSLLGYAGPTLVVIKTKAEGSVLGAMCHSTWKDKRHYYGTAEAFLFQLAPEVHVHPATGVESNFMYLHSTPPMIGDLSSHEAQPHGLGFGGCMEKPRLFIPESMTRCSADFVDRTFASGSLLPNEALEKFEIEDLEVWGVGGAAVISQALAKRDEFRQLEHAAQVDAGSIRDKSFVVDDFTSGLMENKLFEHQQSVRGRHEFQVDEQHGGYKLQC